jgi:hypothetical protein
MALVIDSNNNFQGLASKFQLAFVVSFSLPKQNILKNWVCSSPFRFQRKVLQKNRIGRISHYHLYVVPPFFYVTCMESSGIHFNFGATLVRDSHCIQY